MFLTDIFVLRFAKLRKKKWQTAETYSPQNFSVTVATVAPAVVFCFNSLMISVQPIYYYVICNAVAWVYSTSAHSEY